MFFITKFIMLFKLLFLPVEEAKEKAKEIRAEKKKKREEKREVRRTNKATETKPEKKPVENRKEAPKSIEEMKLEVLRKGDRGFLVEQWQLFLVGQGLLRVADGVFGGGTRAATIKFQKKHGLKPDGIVGNSCYGKAMTLGYEVTKDPSNAKHSAYWPPKPEFQPLYNDEKRMALLGKMEYKANEKGKLVITNNWREENIVTIDVPQIKGISMWGKPKKSGKIYFHKKGAEQMKRLWAEWEKEDLLHLVKTWSGTYCARFIRGSKTKLSNHAYGTAFDINVKWNGLAKRPALVGEEGSVRELVQIANKHGFYWGGHFRRKDGMHFELAKIIEY